MVDTRPTLSTLLSGRRRGVLVAFVAALYAARGATTRVEESVVIVDGERLLVVSGATAVLRSRLRPPTTPITAVVGVDADRVSRVAARFDARPVTVADLDRLARYGLDRDDADALFRTYFERPVAAVAPVSRHASPPAFTAARSSSTSLPSSSAHTPRPRSKTSTSTVTALVGLLGVVAVVVALVNSPATPFLFDRGGSGGAQSGLSTGAAATDVGVANEPRPTPSTDGGDEEDGGPLDLAPGLTLDGVEDPDALAAAHAIALDNQSYRWDLTYVESVDGVVTGRAQESVFVENELRFVSSVTRSGTLVGPSPISAGPSYADGRLRYQLIPDGGVLSTQAGGYGVSGVQGWRANQYLALLLDGENTTTVRTILGDPRLYVVGVDGLDARNIREYTATAHVAPDGLVYYVSASYCFSQTDEAASADTRTDAGSETESDGGRAEDADADADENVCVQLTLQYRDFGTTTVEPPTWFTAARENGTAVGNSENGTAVGNSENGTAVGNSENGTAVGNSENGTAVGNSENGTSG